MASLFLIATILFISVVINIDLLSDDNLIEKPTFMDYLLILSIILGGLITAMIIKRFFFQ